MSPQRFQRARKPEEKAVRRQALLKAAKRLVTTMGPVDLTLTALAKRSGISKPNIYRYFKSREEVLCQLWIGEVGSLVEDLPATLRGVPIGNIDATAKALAFAFSSQPQLCELTSIMATVIEPQLTFDVVLDMKRLLGDLIMRTAQALHAQLPSISLADCAWAAAAIAAHLPGTWPAAHPGPVTASVLARPEFAAMKPDFEREFARFLRVLFSGLVSRDSETTRK
ncbi:MAG TPA: TetR/AcrR family transcriptional regulator [Polyangia bacterium]